MRATCRAQSPLAIAAQASSAANVGPEETPAKPCFPCRFGFEAGLRRSWRWGMAKRRIRCADRLKRLVEYRVDTRAGRSQLNDVRMSKVLRDCLACKHLLP